MMRRHDLDWVRILAFGLLVLYHVGMYYVSWGWHVKSPEAGPALEPFMLLTAPWRMSLLFLVSGVATAFMLKQMPDRFLRLRSWRLLLPLVFGMLVIVPPQAYYELLDSNYPGGYHDGYLAFWARYLQADAGFCDQDGCLTLPTWNHLWFLPYLWAYTVVLWLLLKMAPGTMAAIRERIGDRLAGIGLLLWPIALLAAVRIALVGRFESTHALVDDWYNHAQYFPAFVMGFLIARNDGVWEVTSRMRWPALWLGLASYGFLAWYFSHYNDGNPPAEAVRMLQRVLWALNQWTMIVAILGFARHLVHGDSPTLHYLTPAVYPVYILHQSVIVILAYNLQPFAIPPWVEGPLLASATFAICFGLYEMIRRVRWLRPLFGLTWKAASPLPAAVQPAAAAPDRT